MNTLADAPRRAIGPLGATLLLAACGAPESVAVGAGAGDETVPVVETRWTARTELFLEYPPFVEGQVSRFAAHLTDLATFEPIRTGRLVVRLTGPEPAEFSADSPGRPGIFSIDVTPARAGRYQLELLLDAPGLTDRHDLGEVLVLTPDQAAPSVSEEPDDGSIPFLKEQQWALDFATAPAVEREIAESLVIAAEIEPRTGGQVEVVTPVTGRLAGDRAPRPIGARVTKGETLAEVVPNSGHGDDRPALELDVAEARDALELATATRARRSTGDGGGSTCQAPARGTASRADGRSPRDRGHSAPGATRCDAVRGRQRHE